MSTCEYPTYLLRDLVKLVSQRDAHIYQDFQKGLLTTAAIAKKVALSSGRCNQIRHRVEKKIAQTKAPPLWWHGLPKKAVHPLMALGFRSKEAIQDGLKSGKIHPYAKDLIGFGPYYYGLVCDWAGVPPRMINITPAAVDQAVRLLREKGYRVISPLRMTL